MRAQDLFSLDKGLQAGLSVFPRLVPRKLTTEGVQEDGLLVSLNLAPVWQANRSLPLYAPFDYFQKASMHALVIQDEEVLLRRTDRSSACVDSLRLLLCDKNDVLQLVDRLAEDNSHHGATNQVIPHAEGRKEDRQRGREREMVQMPLLPSTHQYSPLMLSVQQVRLALFNLQSGSLLLEGHRTLHIYDNVAAQTPKQCKARLSELLMKVEGGAGKAW